MNLKHISYITKHIVYIHGRMGWDGECSVFLIYVSKKILICYFRTTAIIFYLSLSEKNQMQKIKLVAENMGTIPPNTALLVIETISKNRYEVNLSSNFEKNASIEFFLKE